jgi:hypothetical protein
MHFFGLVGSATFLIGLLAIIVVGAIKLTALIEGNAARLVTELPYFYLALTCMVIGVLLFLTGFLGELIVRNAPERNHYAVEESF